MNLKHLKKNIYHDQVIFITEMQKWFTTFKSVNTMHRLKDRNHSIISLYVERAFDKIQYIFMIKVLNLWIKGTYTNLIMTVYNKPTANIIQNGEKDFPIKPGMAQNVHSPFSCSVWYLKS